MSNRKYVMTGHRLTLDTIVHLTGPAKVSLKISPKQHNFKKSRRPKDGATFKVVTRGYRGNKGEVFYGLECMRTGLHFTAERSRIERVTKVTQTPPVLSVVPKATKASPKKVKINHSVPVDSKPRVRILSSGHRQFNAAFKRMVVLRYYETKKNGGNLQELRKELKIGNSQMYYWIEQDKANHFTADRAISFMRHTED